MEINKPIWNNKKDEYYIKVLMKNNQVFLMSLQEIDWNLDTVYFICI